MNEIEVTVQSILLSDEPQGRFHLHVSPHNTVEGLLKLLCREAGTSLKSDYRLRSKSHDILLLTDTLYESGVEDGAFLHWTSETVDKKTRHCCNTFWVLALCSFLIGTVGIVAICILKFRNVDVIFDFAIVFDAGSTHTAMFIYKWKGSKLNGTAVAAQYGTKCIADGSGIATFADNPQAAGKSLQSCLDEAKAAIPTNKHSTTPVYLGATAGMRVLNMSNPSASDAILESVQATLSQSPFKFSDPPRAARIISGSEEGTFSWITSNYVTNAFKVPRPDVSETIAYTIVPNIGALDLGGASTQITFLPENSSQVPPEYSIVTKLFGHNYSVYTHSFLCYGVEQMTNRIYAALVQEQSNSTVVQHPCLPSGYNTTLTHETVFASPCVQSHSINSHMINDYNPKINYTFVGLSNNTACASLLDRTLFNRSSCSYNHCSFNGVYQPYVTGLFYITSRTVSVNTLLWRLKVGMEHTWAFSSFFYVTDFLNLTASNTSYFKHQDFLSAIDNICNNTWAQLQQYPATPQEKANLMFYCLQANYINLLLYDGYGFNDSLWTKLNFVGQISATDIGWALGFVLNESGNYPQELPEVAMYTLTFALLMALFCLFLVVSVGLARQGRKFHCHVERQSRRMNQYGAI